MEIVAMNWVILTVDDEYSSQQLRIIGFIKLDGFQTRIHGWKTQMAASLFVSIFLIIS